MRTNGIAAVLALAFVPTVAIVASSNCDDARPIAGAQTPSCGTFAGQDVPPPSPSDRGGQGAVQRWDLSLEERVARRSERAASAIRLARAIAEGELPDGYKVPADGYFVFGRHDPELLMGYELMDRLAVVYAPETELGQKYRSRWLRSGIERFGADFWERLHEVAQPFIDGDVQLRRSLRADVSRKAALNGASGPDRRLSGVTLCRLRAEALARARERFGTKKFDAFLYEVIAPDAGDIYTSPSGDDPPGAMFRWIEGGCR